MDVQRSSSGMAILTDCLVVVLVVVRSSFSWWYALVAVNSKVQPFGAAACGGPAFFLQLWLSAARQG